MFNQKQIDNIRMTAIRSLDPDSQFEISATGTLKWLSPEISIEDIRIEEERILDEWEYLEYSRLRRTEYDKLNQDEMRYDDMVDGTNTWGEAIEAIKLQFPKPVE